MEPSNPSNSNISLTAKLSALSISGPNPPLRRRNSDSAITTPRADPRVEEVARSAVSASTSAATSPATTPTKVKPKRGSLQESSPKSPSPELGIPKRTIARIVSSVPVDKVSLKSNVGSPPRICEYNNYGFTPDKGSIRVEGGIVHFEVGGKPMALQAYTDGKQLFINEIPSIFADVVLATTYDVGSQSFIIADGCGWGQPAKDAAAAVANTALHSIQEQCNKSKGSAIGRGTTTIRKIAQFQLQAIGEAQVKLVEQAKQLEDRKAKLLQAIRDIEAKLMEQLKQLGEQQLEKLKVKYEELNDKYKKLEHLSIGSSTLLIATLVSKNVIVTRNGDSDVVIFNKRLKTCRTVTPIARAQSNDGKDPGGRLSADNPDFKNLQTYVADLVPGDEVIGFTDGITDCLDPMALQKKPADFGCPEEKWQENNPRHIKIREREITRLICEILLSEEQVAAPWFLGKDIHPVARSLISYVDRQQREPKLFLLNRGDARNKPQPGKPDHTSVVVADFTDSG